MMLRILTLVPPASGFPFLNRSKSLSRVRAVLFSTHGFLNANNPALSSLVLGRPDGGYENDRYVTARELATFDMPADLVIVSSCNSGNGRVAAGEGILGLPYALFAAGATTALVTRWSIFDDDATAHLVSDLLIAIDSGEAPDDALTEIKRDLRRTKPEAYWAPFVLLGH
jgi:CHAT domain-containing protein